MCEFAGSLDSRVYGTNDALDLVWQAVHLCKRDGGAKGLLRTGRVGLGKQNLADGDLEDSLPLWRSLGDGPGLPAQQFDGHLGSSGADETSQLDLVQGSGAGQWGVGPVLDRLPGGHDGLVEQLGVAHFASGSCKLHEDGALLVFWS